MKKYQKPEIAFENFEMATSLAAPCMNSAPKGITLDNYQDSLFEFHGNLYFTSNHTCAGGIFSGNLKDIIAQIEVECFTS